MHVIDRRVARYAARTLVLPGAAALLVLATPQAAAHTELLTSTPNGNTTLARLPERIKLTFSDAMTQKYAKIAVTAPDGKAAAAGDPDVTGKDVTLALDTGSPSGKYTVGYRVVSADGHPVSGSYTFTVEQASSSPSPSHSAPKSESTPAAQAAPASEPDSTEGRSSGAGVSALAGVGGLVVIGAGVGAYVMRRRRESHGG